MKDGGGKDMTSPLSGILGSVNLSGYITSKHAVVGVTRATTIESAPRKIGVNTVNSRSENNRMMRSI